MVKGALMFLEDDVASFEKPKFGNPNWVARRAMKEKLFVPPKEILDEIHRLLDVIGNHDFNELEDEDAALGVGTNQTECLGRARARTSNSVEPEPVQEANMYGDDADDFDDMVE